MRFIDYIIGERLALVSDLPPAEVADRLDAKIESMWTPFATGVVGWVAFGRFSLRYRRYAWLRRGWLPILAGHIRAQGAGSRVTIRYRAPLMPLIFLPLWFLFLFLFILNAVATIPPLLWPVLLLGAGFILLWLVKLRALGIEADDDLAKMRAVVEAAAGRSD